PGSGGCRLTHPTAEPQEWALCWWAQPTLRGDASGGPVHHGRSFVAQFGRAHWFGQQLAGDAVERFLQLRDLYLGPVALGLGRPQLLSQRGPLPVGDESVLFPFGEAPGQDRAGGIGVGELPLQLLTDGLQPREFGLELLLGFAHASQGAVPAPDPAVLQTL